MDYKTILVKSRAAFNGQPAINLVVDVGAPIMLESVSNIVAAAQNVLGLSSAIKGHPRITWFGLSVMNAEYRPLLRLTSIKGNFSKIASALEEVMSLARTSSNSSETDFKDFLFLGIRSTLEDIKNCHTGNDGSSEETETKVKIVLITKKDISHIMEYLNETYESFNVINNNALSQIQVVQLVEDVSLPVDTRSPVHIIQVLDSILALEQYFKQWLEEQSLNSEHLVIDIGEDRLKCDIVYCMVNPQCIPFGQRFLINGLSSTPNVPCTAEVPIYHLEAVKRVANGGVSELNIFGLPVCLVPTKYWKDGWDGQAENEQKFLALCQLLERNEEYLVVKLKTADPPNGAYILMPGSGSLLLKSLLCSELSFTTPQISNHSEIPKVIQRQIFKSLNTLETTKVYEPEMMRTGIFHSIRSYLQTNTNKGNQMFNKNYVPTEEDEVYNKRRKRGPVKKKTYLPPKTLLSYYQHVSK